MLFIKRLGGAFIGARSFAADGFCFGRAQQRDNSDTGLRHLY